jgi:DnaJ-domain-containing protein 1
MATDLHLPQEVTSAIGQRIRQAELASIADFPETSKDEDSIMESFGTRLRCRQRIVEVSSSNVYERQGQWKWSISHTRFRGRGRGAPEKKIGADVIIELNLHDAFRYRRKSLLVQAKKNWTTDAKVFEQVAKLITWREAASVINLTSKRFEGFNLDDVVKGRGTRPTSFTILSEFLVEQFVSGELGDETIEYNARHEWLQWLDMKDVLVRSVFPCKQKISISVSTPPPWRNPAAIKPEEIPDHRLAATPQQLLGVARVSDVEEFKKAYRRRQKIYHPDKNSSVPIYVQERLKRESQEINVAYERLTDE